MILTVSSTSNASSIDRSVRASPLLDGPAPGRSRTESRGRSRACVAGVEKRSVMSVVARLYWFRRWKCLIFGSSRFQLLQGTWRRWRWSTAPYARHCSDQVVWLSSLDSSSRPTTWMPSIRPLGGKMIIFLWVLGWEDVDGPSMQYGAKMLYLHRTFSLFPSLSQYPSAFPSSPPSYFHSPSPSSSPFSSRSTRPSPSSLP